MRFIKNQIVKEEGRLLFISQSAGAVVLINQRFKDTFGTPQCRQLADNIKTVYNINKLNDC